ncbi:MAG: PfkB family carbohydrate kinase [Dehalococcoidia bacterium]|nr:sugar kinase [Dehalococcoidia bacterium]MCA9825486.1 sugar kinase [Dehalococcoidia bacterium]MCA9844536.1 sugar kinase [Dehalococcoidia bacterium]
MTLLVTGWVALDDIETPFESRKRVLGGSAAAAALAGQLFTDTRLVAAVGEDFPEEYTAQLAESGVDIGGLVTVPGETSKWGGKYHYDMNTRDTAYTVLGVNETWQPVLPKGWEHSQTAFLAADDPVIQRKVIGKLHNPLATMVDTIRLYMDRDGPELATTFAAATFVCLNDGEAREIAGTASVAAAARTLVARGTQGAVVKLGEYGALFVSKRDYFAAAGYPLEIVRDPTGAGDAFAGAFMGFVDSQGDINPTTLRQATVYGCTVASFQVEGFGPERLLSLTRDEVESRYREMRALTIFEAGE